jgi:hypothetical protein
MTKDRARRLLRQAIDRGEITRPSACEQCGREGRTSDGRAYIHGHHHLGYERPLDVVWLCPFCHFALDLRPSGEAAGSAKLSAAQVTEIRAAYAPGSSWEYRDNSTRSLAKKYGVSERSIRRIINMESWISAAPPPQNSDEVKG